MIGGVAWNVHKGATLGVEALPHLDFWRQLPDLVKVRCSRIPPPLRTPSSLPRLGRTLRWSMAGEGPSQGCTTVHRHQGVRACICGERAAEGLADVDGSSVGWLTVLLSQDGVALTVDWVLVALGRREPRHGGSFEWSGL